MSKAVANLRTLAIIAHGGAGKTSLAEAMLFTTGSTTRLGKVDDGTSILDYEPEEVSRQITISSSFCSFVWNNSPITLIDTPGDFNFLADARTCLHGVDGLLVVVDAIDGVKVQTETGWEFAQQLNLPRVIIINKMDRERADFQKVVNEITEIFGDKAIPVYIPIGAEESFTGVIDLLHNKAYEFQQDGTGKVKEIEVPSDLVDLVASQREQMIERIAEADDDLLEKYLEGEELSGKELAEGLRAGCIAGEIFPITCGSATKNMGIQPLLDLIMNCLPSPQDRGAKAGVNPKDGSEEGRKPDEKEPFSAQVIKTISDPYAGRLSVLRVFSGTLTADSTVYNASKEAKERFGSLLLMQGKNQKSVEVAIPGEIVAVAKLKDTLTGDTLCDQKNPVVFAAPETIAPIVSMAVQPKSRGDEDKIFSSLARLMEEDPTLMVHRNDQTKETILSGMGDIHIEASLGKLKRKFGVEVNLSSPKVPYLETIRKPVKGVVYRHKKQTGGRGQFAEVHFDITPLERGAGFEFEEALVGMNVPRGFVPAVEKGINETMHSGVRAGYPVVDFKVRFYDGKSHEVDSSEMAFKIAASMCFKKGVAEAQPTLLEPIMELEVTVPDENMGDVIGDLNSRRGKVLGMDSKGRNQVIRASVPMAEVLKYAPDLRSMTGGRGMFTMTQSHYEEVPAHLQEQLVAEVQKEKEE
ncbi:MAG: elongation factor G [Deltaproteobacteria bacterium]|nr:MAG: elongation factor G [Deltaproteobacteria bacterium]